MDALSPEKARSIGHNVRMARSANGLSQVAVATELGLSFGFVSKVERGRMRRVTTDLLRLLRFLRLGDVNEDGRRGGDDPVTVPIAFRALAPGGRDEYELALTTRDDVARLVDAKVFDITLRGVSVVTVADERWQHRVRCRIQYPIAATIRILPKRE